MQRSVANGLPARAALRPDGLYLDLRGIEPTELHDPFLQQTVQRLGREGTVARIQPQDVGKVPPGSAPAGIVYHVGRCGSTLVSQLLKQLDRVVVYSEPLAVNDILVPPHAWQPAGRVGALRTLGAVLARHAGTPYVLKLSSWNTLYCDLVAEAFPSTPWVFCVRDPVEACVSLLERRPGWLRDAGEPSHLFARVVDPAGASRTAEEYLARLNGAYCRSIAALDSGRGALVSYESLPEAVWIVVAPRFGLAVDGRARARMAEAAQAHSKAGADDETAFVPDGSRKRAAAAPVLREAVDVHARPELERLSARFQSR